MIVQFALPSICRLELGSLRRHRFRSVSPALISNDCGRIVKVMKIPTYHTVKSDQYLGGFGEMEDSGGAGKTC